MLPVGSTHQSQSTEEGLHASSDTSIMMGNGLTGTGSEAPGRKKMEVVRRAVERELYSYCCVVIKYGGYEGARAEG